MQIGISMIDFGQIISSNVSSPSQLPSDTSTETSTKDRLSPDNPENDKSANENQSPAANTEDLSSEEVRQLAELRQRDREVRAHEQAHIAAGGSYVRSGARFEYEKGPDGNNYAVGGEVSIDTSKVSGDPEGTVRKMQVIRSAALAPASPSAQDRRVAAQATQKENQARMEIVTERYEEASTLQPEAGETEPSDTDDSGKRTPASVSLGGLIDITQ